MLKIITVFNWIGVGALAILVLALLFEPSRGGDAATKGLGGAFIIFGLVAMAVLITLSNVSEITFQFREQVFRSGKASK